LRALRCCTMSPLPTWADADMAAKKAKTNKPKTKKPNARKVAICVDDLHDPHRWWHLLKVYTLLLPQHGASTGFDLWKELKSGKLPCVHRPTNSARCYVLPRSFWLDREFEENHGNSPVRLKNEPASMLPGDGAQSRCKSEKVRIRPALGLYP